MSTITKVNPSDMSIVITDMLTAGPSLSFSRLDRCTGILKSGDNIYLCDWRDGAHPTLEQGLFRFSVAAGDFVQFVYLIPYSPLYSPTNAFWDPLSIAFPAAEAVPAPTGSAGHVIW